MCELFCVQVLNSIHVTVQRQDLEKALGWDIHNSTDCAFMEGIGTRNRISFFYRRLARRYRRLER